MNNLNYKASNIARAERELKANFFKTLEGLDKDTPSVNSLLVILRAGGLSEDEADTYLDEYGITDALKAAVEALGNAGFLAKMKNQTQTVNSQPVTVEASPNSGDQTNP